MANKQVIECSDSVHSVAVSPDNQMIAIGFPCGGGGGVVLLNARASKWRSWEIDEDEHLTCVAFSPACFSSSLLLATGLDYGAVKVWDCDKHTCVAAMRGKTYHTVDRINFSPDGRLLMAASRDCTVRLWHTDDWRERATFVRDELMMSCMFDVSFSCDNRMLASFSSVLRVWHVVVDDVTASGLAASGLAASGLAAPGLAASGLAASGLAASGLAASGLAAPGLAASAANLSFFAGPTLEMEKIVCAAFSPVDNTLLACGSTDGKLVLARVGDDAMDIEYIRQGHAAEVQSLAFSPNGKQLASASSDHTLRLWSVATGACLRVLRGHTARVSSVAFFPNGKQLVSGASDNTVRFWTVCAWSDRVHHLFSARLKAAVYTLMCVRARLEQDGLRARLPRLPMEVWLLVFGQLQLALDM